MATAEEIQQIKDTEHLRLLSIFHFVNAAFFLLGLLGLVLHGVMFGLVFSDTFRPAGARPSNLPPHFFKFFIGFYIVAANLMAVHIIFNVLSGLALRKRKRRMLSLIVAGVNCLQMPLGTILGVFTIVVLMRDSVRQTYEQQALEMDNGVN